MSICLNEMLFFLLRLRGRRKVPAGSGDIYVLRFAHIGDFLIWLDSAGAYRRLYPGRRIVFLTYSYKNVTELAEASGCFDQVVSFDTEGLGRIGPLRQAGRMQGDVVINANPSRSLLSDLFVMAVNVNLRIAQQSDTTEMEAKKLARSDRIYDRIIPCSRTEMELIRNAQFIRGLGLEDFRAGLFTIPEIPCGIDIPPEPYAVIFPDADTEIKMWNYRNFAEIVRRLAGKYAYKCLILGSGRYRETGEAIRKAAGGYDCVNLMGRTTLPECIQYVRNAALVVSNDTGGAHIAAGTRTPCVVLAIGWNRGRFFPYRTERVQEGDRFPADIVADVDCLGCGIENIDRFRPACAVGGVPGCLAQVTVGDVMEKIESIMMEAANGCKGQAEQD